MTLPRRTFLKTLLLAPLAAVVRPATPARVRCGMPGILGKLSYTDTAIDCTLRESEIRRLLEVQAHIARIPPESLAEGLQLQWDEMHTAAFKKLPFPPVDL